MLGKKHGMYRMNINVMTDLINYGKVDRDDARFIKFKAHLKMCRNDVMMCDCEGILK